MYVYLYIVLRYKQFLSGTCAINSSFLRLRTVLQCAVLIQCCCNCWGCIVAVICDVSICLCLGVVAWAVIIWDIFTPAVWSLWKSVSCLNPKHMKNWTKLHIAKKIWCMIFYRRTHMIHSSIHSCFRVGLFTYSLHSLIIFQINYASILVSN